MREIKKRVYFWSAADAEAFEAAWRNPAKSRHSFKERHPDMDEHGLECWSVVMLLNVNDEGDS